GVDIAERADLAVRRIHASEKRAALTADADEAEAHRSAANRPLHRRGSAQRGERGRPRQRFDEVAAADRALFGRQRHESGCSGEWRQRLRPCRTKAPSFSLSEASAKPSGGGGAPAPVKKPD